MPPFIRDSLEAITKLVSPPAPTVDEEATEEEAVAAFATDTAELEVTGDGFDDLS